MVVCVSPTHVQYMYIYIHCTCIHNSGVAVLLRANRARVALMHYFAGSIRGPVCIKECIETVGFLARPLKASIIRIVCNAVGDACKCSGV